MKLGKIVDKNIMWVGGNCIWLGVQRMCEVNPWHPWVVRLSEKHSQTFSSLPLELGEFVKTVTKRSRAPDWEL